MLVCVQLRKMTTTTMVPMSYHSQQKPLLLKSGLELETVPQDRSKNRTIREDTNSDMCYCHDHHHWLYAWLSSCLSVAGCQCHVCIIYATASWFSRKYLQMPWSSLIYMLFCCYTPATCGCRNRGAAGKFWGYFLSDSTKLCILRTHILKYMTSCLGKKEWPDLCLGPVVYTKDDVCGRDVPNIRFVFASVLT